MTLQQIIYIIEIAKCSSINQAAQNLYTHQSNISNSLKQLEQELHICIFRRTTKGVEITNEGKEFLSYAQSLLNQKNFIEDIYANRKAEKPLYFNVSSMRSYFMTQPFLCNFEQSKDKAIYFRFKKESMYHVIDDVATGESNLGVIFLSKLTKKSMLKFIASKKLDAQFLGRSRLSIVMRDGHPLLKEKDLSTLSDYPYVIIEENQGFNKLFEEETGLLSSLFRSVPKQIISTTDSIAQHFIVNSTDAFFISTCPWRHSEHFNFKSIPLAGEENCVEIYCLTQSNKVLSPYTQTFINSIRNSCHLDEEE